MTQFRKVVNWITRVGVWVGICFLLAMMVLIVADVILRPLGEPITPVYEWLELLSAAAISFAIVYTTREKSHIIIDILTMHFPNRARAVMEAITSFVSLGTIALLGYSTIKFNKQAMLMHEQTQISHVQIFPFRYLWLFAIAMIILLPVLQISDAINRARSKGGNA